MARLTQARADRLVSTLTAPLAPPSTARAGAQVSGQAIRDRLRSRAADGSLANALSTALSSYLNRSVRCSSPVTVSQAGTMWHYAVEAGSFRWTISFEEGLGLAIADAMIGGEGRGSRLNPNGRVKRLIALAAAKFVECAASVAQLELPGAHAPFADEAIRQNDAVAVSGLCALKDEFFWQLRVADAVGFEILRHSELEPRDAEREPLVAPALAAAARVLGELTRSECRLAANLQTADTFADARTNGVAASVQHGDRGQLVVRTNDEGARVLAAAALRCDLRALPATGPGMVLRSVAETLLRAALERFGSAVEAQQDITAALPLVTGGVIGDRALTLSWALECDK